MNRWAAKPAQSEEVGGETDADGDGEADGEVAAEGELDLGRGDDVPVTGADV